MAQSLNPTLQGTLAGAVLLLAVLGGSAYAYLVLAKPEPAVATPAAVSSSVIDTEMKAGGIFDQSARLVEIESSQPTAIQAAPSELGKTDITKFE